MKIQAHFDIPRTPALHFDFSLACEGITAVFGKSGCGKTSLLRALAGLEKHPGAELIVDGETWQDKNIFVSTHNRAIAYVFQEASLFDHLTVTKNIEYGFKRTAPTDRKIPLQKIISLLELEPLLQRSPATLSGGERQRVAIARALAVSPRLLLMDEPLASLDQALRDTMLNYIETLNRQLGVPIIYVSHSDAEIIRLATLMIFIEHGGIRAIGPTAELLTDTELSLAHRREAQSLIAATVTDYDEEFRINKLQSPAGEFLVAGARLSEGREVRLRLAAQDISLTLQALHDTSILNSFPALVDGLTEEANAHVTVRLMIHEVPVLARITLKSARALQLEKGKQVFAHIKSVAVLA